MNPQTIRMRVSWLPELLLRLGPGLRVVHLVRDPRASFRSSVTYAPSQKDHTTYCPLILEVRGGWRGGMGRERGQRIEGWGERKGRGRGDRKTRIKRGNGGMEEREDRERRDQRETRMKGKGGGGEGNGEREKRKKEREIKMRKKWKN